MSSFVRRHTRQKVALSCFCLASFLYICWAFHFSNTFSETTINFARYLSSQSLEDGQYSQYVPDSSTGSKAPFFSEEKMNVVREDHLSYNNHTIVNKEEEATEIFQPTDRSSVPSSVYAVRGSEKYIPNKEDIFPIPLQMTHSSEQNEELATEERSKNENTLKEERKETEETAREERRENDELAKEERRENDEIAREERRENGEIVEEERRENEEIKEEERKKNEELTIEDEIENNEIATEERRENEEIAEEGKIENDKIEREWTRENKEIVKEGRIENNENAKEEKRENEELAIEEEGENYEIVMEQRRKNNEIVEEERRENNEIVKEGRRENNEIVEEERKENNEIVEEERKENNEIVEEERRENDETVKEERRDYNEIVVEERRENNEVVKEERRENNEVVKEEKRENNKIVEEERGENNEIVEEERKENNEIVEEERRGNNEIVEEERRENDEIVEEERRENDEIVEEERRENYEIATEEKRENDEIVRPERIESDEIVKEEKRENDVIVGTERRENEEIAEEERRENDEVVKEDKREKDVFEEEDKREIDELAEEERKENDEIVGTRRREREENLKEDIRENEEITKEERRKNEEMKEGRRENEQEVEEGDSALHFSEVKPTFFQQIEDREAWVFSAYYDELFQENDKATLRAFGIAHMGNEGPILCHLEFREGQKITTPGYVRNLKNQRNTYRDVYFLCQLPEDALPSFVSFSFSEKISTRLLNRLPVIYTKNSTSSREISVCYGVLHSKFNLSAQVLQSIEFNQLMGAEHLFIYVYSVDENVRKVLNYYESKKILTAFQYELPSNTSLELLYYGQKTALNDCLFRNRHVSEFVAIVDTDELLVPKQDSSWADLMKKVDSERIYVIEDSRELRFENPEDRPHAYFLPPRKKIEKVSRLSDLRVDVFIFVTAYFYANAKPDPEDILKNCSDMSEAEFELLAMNNFSSLVSVWRETRTFPLGYRTKSIMRPEAINVVGMHFPDMGLDRLRMVEIPEQYALGYHYKHMLTMTEKNRKFEPNILRLKKELYPRLLNAAKHLPTVFSIKSN